MTSHSLTLQTLGGLLTSLSLQCSDPCFHSPARVTPGSYWRSQLDILTVTSWWQQAAASLTWGWLSDMVGVVSNFWSSEQLFMPHGHKTWKLITYKETDNRILLFIQKVVCHQMPPTLHSVLCLLPSVLPFTSSSCAQGSNVFLIPLS